jgi:prolipoprotein diacylglyceryltransferase
VREDRLPAVKIVRLGEYANTSLFGRPASAANQNFTGPVMAQNRERNNQSRTAEDAEMLDAGARVTKPNQKTLVVKRDAGSLLSS